MFDQEPDGDPHGECALEIARLTARLAECEAEREAMRADAEMYRWLNVQRNGWHVERWIDGTWKVITGAALTKAIAAARKS